MTLLLMGKKGPLQLNCWALGIQNPASYHQLWLSEVTSPAEADALLGEQGYRSRYHALCPIPGKQHSLASRATLWSSKPCSCNKTRRWCVFQDFPPPPTPTQSDAHVPIKLAEEDFPGGTVERNPPAKAGNTGWISGPGGFHMSRSS